MPRLLFEKTGNAIWISHLDLMRVFQRAFKRAGYPLTHTHGYNPRPSVSIALPLSVGISSQCELLDFDLDCEITDFDEVRDKLNAVLIQGVRIREVYPDGMKIRDLAFLETYIDLVYDDHSSLQEKCESLSKLFSVQSLSVVKKNKNGSQDQDIIPMIKSIEFSEVGEDCLRINLRHCCQNPTLNPMQVVAAIEKNLPELTPVATRCGRLEVFDMHFNVFR